MGQRMSDYPDNALDTAVKASGSPVIPAEIAPRGCRSPSTPPARGPGCWRDDDRSFHPSRLM